MPCFWEPEEYKHVGGGRFVSRSIDLQIKLKVKILNQKFTTIFVNEKRKKNMAWVLGTEAEETWYLR